MFTFVIKGADGSVKLRKLFLTVEEIEDAVVAFIEKETGTCEAYDPDEKLICAAKVTR